MTKRAPFPADSAFGVTCSELVTDGGAVPTRILIFPMGTHKTRDGRGPYTLADKAHGESVIAATCAKLGRADFMFDYDHQSVFGSVPGVGGQAKAAGWSAKAFEVDDAGIWATVAWTEAASAAIAAREYRYISPYFTHAKDGRLTAFRNAALVNQPALDLDAIAASFLDQETPMKAIALALGLAETADEAAILAAIGSTKTVLTATCSALAIAADADATAVTAAIAGLKAAPKDADPDPSLYVPKAAFDEVRAQVASLLDTANTEAVDAAIAAGKLTPALKDWGLKLIAKSPDEFAAYCGLAPVLAPGKLPGGKIDAASDGLTDEEAATCSAWGLTPEEYVASRKQLEGAK